MLRFTILPRFKIGLKLLVQLVDNLKTILRHPRLADVAFHNFTYSDSL